MDKIARMATQDDFVKTALRLPRSLHARIQEAAATAGRSMNAEIIDRLQMGSGEAVMAGVLDRLRESDGELLETTRKQRDLLWNIVDRTEEVLDQTVELLRPGASTAVAGDSIRQSVAALRDLINTIKAYR